MLQATDKPRGIDSSQNNWVTSKAVTWLFDQRKPMVSNGKRIASKGPIPISLQDCKLTVYLCIPKSCCQADPNRSS